MTKRTDNWILALDNMPFHLALELANRKDNPIPMVKMGLELFLQVGREGLLTLAEESKKEIFLDLKLHDIPNTISKAIKGLQGLPIKFLTIHLGGGKTMIKEAMKACHEYLPQTTLLGVSILTSLAPVDLEEIYGIQGEDFNDQFVRMINLAHACQLKGIVCSAHESKIVKSIASDIITVCPGIRFKEDLKEGSHDQKRVMTPEQAQSNGADYLVIGRCLTQHLGRFKDLNS